MPTLEVKPHWRDRLWYGTAIPALLLVGGAALVLGLPPPPSAGAAAAVYGFALLALLVGATFALTAWRSRLSVGPNGILIRAAVREQLVPWGRVERVEVGRPYRYAGRRGRGPRWQALHVRVLGARAPLVAAATNRPKPSMGALLAEVDAALAVYGHRVARDPVP